MMYTIPVIVTLVLYIEEFFMPFMIQERKKMISCQKDDLKDILCHSILSVAVVSVWIIILSYVALLSMYFTAGLPMRGNLLLYFISMIACTLNMVAFSTMCFAIVRKEKYFALFIQIFCTVTSTHVIMGGINYPFYMMPEWVKMLSNLIYPLTPMLEGLKALNLKGVGWEQMLPYLLNSLRYTIMWMAAAIFILKKDLTNSREKYHNGRSEEYLEGRSETECDQQMNC